MKKPSDYKQFVQEASKRLDAVKNSASTYMGGTEVLTRIFTGQKMFVDTRDISESPHLIIDGIWEAEISYLFTKLIQPGDIVFDVGATYGYYGVVAGVELRQKEGAKLFLIDANPIYEPYMIKNLTVNGQIGYSTVSTVAISGKDGELELNVLKDDWASSTFQTIEEFDKHRTAPYEVDKTIKVQATTLDKYAKEHGVDSADLIKLDIEGLEEESYPGMAKLIKNSPNLKILFEFTTESYKEPKKLYAQIRKDFEFVYCMPDGGEPVLIDTYDDMLRIADGGWIMLLISKVDVSSLL